MFKDDTGDTIAAISTGVGEAGIGIVRLSGPLALEAAGRIFVSKDGKKPADFKSYTTHYGWVVERSAGAAENIIDEAILTVMRAPRSYTKEDIAEINCHGGVVALRKTLDLALENGARLACPGEFTKRAFLNGRIDLAQAEAVLDIIRAKTDSALKIGSEQLSGTLSKRLNDFRRQLLEILALLEANIDFPEEDAVPAALAQVSAKLSRISISLEDIARTFKHGRILREGLRVVICGRPNAGKSSLLNALLKQERSIVTAIAGTTRDVIEEVIDIKGIPVRIVDTAGIIEPRDLVEKKAVQRAKEHIAQADLVILLFDASRKLGKDDFALIRRLKKKKTLAVLNKIDLKEKIGREKISKIFKQVIGISAKKSKNIALLEEAIAGMAYRGQVSASEPVIVSNLRQAHEIARAQKLIEEALLSLDNKLTLELVAQSLKEALGCLDEVLGKKFSEGILDKIFSRFCIGK